MTRKCVLCKATNYKNTYSFFSAPKDPETRKKWQAAIGIDNYAVTDDTYVCSKHFHKNDIITHWVSGVPPHVITIKYKKFRLRPGAVPGRNYHSEGNLEASRNEQSEVYEINMNDFLVFKSEDEETEKQKDFLIPRESMRSYESSHEPPSSMGKRRNNRRHSSESESSQYGDGEKEYRHSRKWLKDDFDTMDIGCSFGREGNDEVSNKYSEVQLDESNTGIHRDRIAKSELECSEESTPREELGNNRCDEKFDREKRIEGPPAERFSKTINQKEREEREERDERIERIERIERVERDEEDYVEEWEKEAKASVGNTLRTMEDLFYANSQFSLNSSSSLDTCNRNENESDMLFEDLLEVCTEISLPRGWSCLVASKGHATTIVYVYMGMTKSGIPFVEKQVFLKSDMLLRCVAANKEINPLIHNLIKEDKGTKVQSLVDIEELIDEFDQRTVCKGICNTEDFQRIHVQRVAYRDGIKWRHISCPLIINNDSSRCSKCITLSRAFTTPKSKLLFPFAYYKNVDSPSRERRRIRRCMRECDRRYKFTKLFRKIE